ncbi:MAG TPA: POTRA domain-containing protein [Verrucomicrobiae bacterium]|nr:POTRA domain-containing protein [Verrucomicrobiae bacterium]
MLRRFALCLWWRAIPITTLFSAEPNHPGPPPAVTNAPSLSATKAEPRFNVRVYQVWGEPSIATNLVTSAFCKYTGPEVGLSEIAQAAAALQAQYAKQGKPAVSVAVAFGNITNGVVTMNVFRGSVPQILVSGKRYTLNEHAASQKIPPEKTTTAAGTASNTQTNTGPHFTVRHYQILGDTLLTTEALTRVLSKYTGTNVSISDILKAASDLQMEYRDRGFPTVSVTIPQQRITNDMVKIRVFEGRLSDIVVTGNRFFSSNNVMRNLPGLHANTILSGPVFQAEVDRANANRDRQIYPQVQPGEEPNTTELVLQVKDRLPLHAKIEFNNQSSPGTPELRLNSSAEYDNLWGYEHSFGVQYSFSPEQDKAGNQWNWYDTPLVANYSAFYRMPLGNPEAIADVIASQPGNFGYNEATRKFQLPPPSGRSELNFYASRATIDTGLETLQSELLYNVPGVRQVSRQDVQEDITLNEDIGVRWSEPGQGTEQFRSTLSPGLDFKTYSLLSTKTNNFSFTEITVNANGTTNPPVISTVASPVPTTYTPLNYLPFSLRYDASMRDSGGTTFIGLGFSMNTWYSGSSSNLHAATGSTQSSGHWVAFTPSISRDFIVYTNWVLTARADGQWASEPLVSVERFGVGGVNSVRGYREGEIFGDTGWHITLEQKTPPHVIGLAYSKAPLTVRGAVYMDYAEAYLLDPQGAKSRIPLWGAGFGGVFSLGTHWEARLLFSLPLLSAGTTEALQPRFNFALVGQF